jgi:hypothetical protein
VQRKGEKGREGRDIERDTRNEREGMRKIEILWKKERRTRERERSWEIKKRGERKRGDK